MYVYPGAQWGPLGLITYVRCLGQQKMLSVSSPESFVWVHRSNTRWQLGILGISTPHHPGISTEKADSYFKQISETSNNIWEFIQLETRKMFHMSEVLPFQVLEAAIHGVQGTEWDCHEKSRCKIRMMRQYFSDRCSNLYMFLYSLPGIFFKDLLNPCSF